MPRPTRRCGSDRRAALGRGLAREVSLTADQETAIAELRADIGRETPMLRLLQGDVGSGKTVVAAYALAAAARAGLQGALLAPTDLLARQHATTARRIARDAGVGVTLLAGSLSAEGTRKVLDVIRSGQARRRDRDARAHPGAGRRSRRWASS